MHHLKRKLCLGVVMCVIFYTVRMYFKRSCNYLVLAFMLDYPRNDSIFGNDGMGLKHAVLYELLNS